MWFAKFIVCSLAISWTGATEEVQVEIPLGSVKGLKSTTVLSKPYYSFKGIPYVKPTVGDNRFKPSQPAEPWSGVYDATEHKSSCVFYCMIRQGIMGDEDCLYLNVYTPDVNKDAAKAVIVVIHGGSFNGGSGDDEIYGPDFLVENDVVLVTFNFRLGALGFLNADDASAPGNVGLKDQVMALKWVQENIENFGGSPRRVTLLGQNSGGAAAQYHVLSPMSEGLFSRVVMQSGSVLNSWSFTYDHKELAFKLGELLGIRTSDSTELVERLKEKSAKEIVDASGQLMKSLNALNGHMHAFVPSIEADVGQEIFLANVPWDLVKSGKINDVPVIAGINADESMMFTKQMLRNADYINANFDKFVPDDLNVTDPSRLKEIGESIRSFYLDGKSVSEDTVQEFSNMLSDIFFNYGLLISTKVMGSRVASPVYYYMFTYESPLGLMKNLKIFDVVRGVSHGDEILYEFYSSAFKNIHEKGSPADRVTNELTKLWTNFAKDGNPTSVMDNYVTVDWEPMGKDDNYLNINKDLKMGKHLMKDRVHFWVEIYKDVLGDYLKNFQ
ncbi:esterase FE4 [Cephus cinctus]|uniref:Carboxylesterase 2 n=1 Tax=Cephus cinctus TaxID=211228 RepID=A0A1W6L1F0_CEPCN|nr:esterase FE4 [Cephus cinctus]ARN17869.1 carboxylesterase 2 [Cephus cinctus]